MSGFYGVIMWLLGVVFWMVDVWCVVISRVLLDGFFDVVAGC